jgi:hypothetical protein
VKLQVVTENSIICRHQHKLMAPQFVLVLLGDKCANLYVMYVALFVQLYYLLNNVSNILLVLTSFGVVNPLSSYIALFLYYMYLCEGKGK